MNKRRKSQTTASLQKPNQQVAPNETPKMILQQFTVVGLVFFINPYNLRSWRFGVTMAKCLKLMLFYATFPIASSLYGSNYHGPEAPKPISASYKCNLAQHKQLHSHRKYHCHCRCNAQCSPLHPSTLRWPYALG